MIADYLFNTIEGEAEHAPSPLQQELLKADKGNYCLAVSERSDKEQGRGRTRAEPAATGENKLFPDYLHISGLERSDIITRNFPTPIHLSAFQNAGSVAAWCVWKEAGRQTVCRAGLLDWPMSRVPADRRYPRFPVC